jgi:hypothetical protein
MASKELVYTVKIQTEGGDLVEKTAKSANELRESYSSLTKAISEQPIGSEKWNQLNTALGDTKRAMNEVAEAEKQAQKGAEELAAEAAKAEEELKKTAAASGSFSDKLSAIPGPVGQVVQGVKGLNAAFKLLIASPVGLILAAITLALTTLYKAFTSTKAGGEMLERVMAGLGAVVDVLRDRVVKIVGAIGKLISGDFVGAFTDAKDAVTGIGGEVSKEFQEAAKIKGELQAIDDATRNLNNTRAEQNKLIAEAKLKINDENLSYAERQQALEDVRKAEVGLAEQEATLAERRYEAIKAQNALSDSSKEALDEEAQAYQALQAAQLASLQKQKEIFDQQKALRDKEKAERKAAADERKRQVEEIQKFEQDLTLSLITDETERAQKEAEIRRKEQMDTIKNLVTTEKEKARLRLLVEEQYQNDLQKIQDDVDKAKEEKQKEEDDKEKEKKQAQLDAQKSQNDALIQLEMMRIEEMGVVDLSDLERLKNLLKEKMELELANIDETSAEGQLIIANYNRAIQAMDKQTADNKKGLAEADALATIDALNTISSAFGEQNAFGKAAAISSAGISTYLSAQKAYESAIGIPVIGPVLAPIAAAAAVAAGLKTIQKIQSTPLETAPKYATGGIVQGVGGPMSDSVMARLSPGEAVINANSTSRFSSLLSEINQAGGGAAFDATGLMSNGGQSGGGETPLIKTYVVSSEMTNQQQFDSIIKSRSTL